MLARRLEPLRVFVETEIGQVHVVVLDVVCIGFLVIVRAKARKTFVAKVGLDRIDASDKYVQPTIKLLFVDNQRIVDVALHQVFVVESRLRQISELFQQDDSVTATSFRRLRDERLSRVLSQVMLEVPHLVRQ